MNPLQYEKTDSLDSLLVEKVQIIAGAKLSA